MSELPSNQSLPAAASKRSRRNLALLLIIAGGVILLGNSGVFGALVWHLVLPLVLIGVGLDLVTQGHQRRRIAVGAGVTALTLAPLVGGAQFIGHERMGMTPPMLRHQEVGSIENIERVTARVVLTAGELSIDALPERSQAVASLGQEERRGLNFERDGRKAVVQVDHPLNAGDLDLQLTRRVPVALTIEMGVGDLSDLDLSDLQLAKLDIKQTAGSAEITLPRRGVMEITISSNLSDIEVDIPDELAARVEVKTSVGEVDVDDRFQLQDGVYLSDNYRDDAPNRATILITTTAGTINVR